MNVPGLHETNLRRLIQALRELAVGGTNACSSFTLNPDATRTLVLDRLCTETSLPVPVAFSIGASTVAWWVDSVEKGQFTIGHDAAPLDALFRYELRQPDATSTS